MDQSRCGVPYGVPRPLLHGLAGIIQVVAFGGALAACCPGVTTHHLVYQVPASPAEATTTSVTTTVSVPDEHSASIDEAVRLAVQIVFSAEFNETMSEVWEEIQSVNATCDPAVHYCDPAYRALTESEWDISKLQTVLREGISIDVKYACHPSTVGWEGGVEGPILLACNRIGSRSVDQWAGTIVHEITHRAGYTHTDNTSDCPSACCIPYVAGYLASQIAWQQLPVESRRSSWDPGDKLCSVLASKIGAESLRTCAPLKSR